MGIFLEPLSFAYYCESIEVIVYKKNLTNSKMMVILINSMPITIPTKASGIKTSSKREILTKICSVSSSLGFTFSYPIK